MGWNRTSGLQQRENGTLTGHPHSLLWERNALLPLSFLMSAERSAIKRSDANPYCSSSANDPATKETVGEMLIRMFRVVRGDHTSDYVNHLSEPFAQVEYNEKLLLYNSYV